MDAQERRLWKHLERIRKDPSCEPLRERYSHYLNLYDHMYKVPKELNVVCATYNVGEANARSVGNISDWLRMETQPDIVCISLQEVDMRAQAFVMQGKRREHWHSEFVKALGHGYTEVASLHLVGMLVEVWVKNIHSPFLRNVRAAHCGTGTMGMGNKGALAVRFSLYHKRFAFVGSHFAARREHWNKRNQTYYSILKELIFDLPTNAEDEIDMLVQAAMWEPIHGDYTGPQASMNTTNVIDRCPQILEKHDYVFWLGDLNYRLIANDADWCRRMIDNKEFETLLLQDQLTISRQDMQVFNLFHEAPVKFAPTYKYDVGSIVYDTSAKARTPSWTDRILYFLQRPSSAGDFTINNGIEISAYGRFEYLLSDHRPVSSSLRVHAVDVNMEVLNSMLQLICREVQPEVFPVTDTELEEPVRRLYALFRPDKEHALEQALSIINASWSKMLESLRKENPEVVVGRYGLPLVYTEALLQIEEEETMLRRWTVMMEVKLFRVMHSFEQTALGEILSRELAQDDEDQAEGKKGIMETVTS
eukprot:PhF_6_TR26716/c0_g1_i2/m.39097/K01099/INPP5B_F; inositol polyphosphate 5-phosphatase INPP5B/F